MKIHRISLIAALALGGLLVCTTLTNAQDAPKGKKGRQTIEQRVERLTKDLSLTDDQKTKVQAALEDEQKQMRDLRSDTANSDPQQRREKMQEIRKGTDKKMKEILKPDQWEKYQKMQEEMRQRKGAPAGEKKDQ
jgi:periplasmic protein CpxP/Spy